MKLFSFFKSAVSPKKSQLPPIGATLGQISSDEYANYTRLLDWLKNTKNKMPVADPALRKESYEVDPLIKGTIVPFLKNVLLQGNEIKTADNKRFAQAIEDIQSYLEEIALMDAFREDAKDLLILTGHSYRRRDYQAGSEKLAKLVRLEPSSIRTYEDPWDSNIVAYHQHIEVPDSWTVDSPTNTVDCWFIPEGLPYIQEEHEDPKALETFDQVAQKYGIQDKQNLRVDSADRIIAMHRVNPGDPAPIDSVILAIWLKRLLLVNSPNLIFRVLSPFIHVVSGKLLEVTDIDGSKRLISSVPPRPPEEMQTTDPEQYNALAANYNSWKGAIKRAIRDIINALKDGGAYASGPDMEIKVVESGREVSYKLIDSLIKLLNEEIGQACGFPMALISANGSELATSRTILQFFNSVHAGARRDYQTVADQLIQERFEGTTWTVDLEPGKEGDPTTDTYSFKDLQAEFLLVTPDVKDALEQAEAGLKKAQELETLSKVGASKEDVQALADERGYGMLGLDNYGQTTATPQQPQASMVRSAAETDPSGSEGDTLSRKLRDAYETARKAVGDLLGN
ncbi:hypothetical protein MSSAC_1014 [Methanosarcina siciliae C2J]|uniref:Portal protein n=1 Tax=Methanosarcina siciliae C2J TaxID=1434118 RepID=A0A0E3PLD5_9EURY|nr:hypothetical protein [Methanosarcina siciliae]AKB35604.1 hypothetical protein MSSAC_1014 [Methanosarcina siciliae C2J]